MLRIARYGRRLRFRDLSSNRSFFFADEKPPFLRTRTCALFPELPSRNDAPEYRPLILEVCP